MPIQSQRWLVVANERFRQETAWCATSALAKTGRVYLMAGQPVELMDRRDLSACDIRTLDHKWMTEVLARSVDCVTWDGKTGQFEPGPSAQQLARLILTYRPYEALPVLSGLMVGTANPDTGEGHKVPGYNPTTRMYVVSGDADPAAFQSPDLTLDQELDELLNSLAS